MMKVNSSLEEYIELYSKSSYDSLSIDRDLPAYENNLEVKNVMYGMMSEPDKLNELTKLIGNSHLLMKVMSLLSQKKPKKKYLYYLPICLFTTEYQA